MGLPAYRRRAHPPWPPPCGVERVEHPKRFRVEPAPTRSTASWTAFLRSQAAAACDFATVDSALGRRFYLLFFIDVPTRRVTLAGITTNPTGPWTTQAARNLFLAGGETLHGCRMLVRDRAGQFTASFDEIFHTEGIRVATTPVRTPVANCYIERWIGSLRRELLDRTIIWNEPQLRRLIVDYLEHYNEHRPHRTDRFPGPGSSRRRSVKLARAQPTDTLVGIPSHVLPSSSRPPDLGVLPPHCLKKNGTSAWPH